MFAQKNTSNSAEKPAELPSDALQQAMSHHQSGNFAQAEALYRQILQQQPHHPDALHFLGVLAYQVGQSEAAVELITQAIAISPNASAMYCNLALALQTLGRFEQAAENYQHALQLRPDQSEVHFSLGNALQAQGKLHEAANSYQNALALQPQHLQALQNLADIWVMQQKSKQAIALYRAVLALNPEALQVLNNLGCLLKEQGELREAVEIFEKLLALAPEDAAGHYNLATALQEQKNLTAAVAHYQQAILFKPDDPQAYYNLAMALKEQGKLEAAITQFQQAIGAKPDYADAHHHLGITLQIQNDLDAAIHHYQQTILFNPTITDAYNNLGSALQAQQRFAEAIANYRHALLLKPNSPLILNNLGLALQAQGQFEAAQDSYLQALALNSADAQAHYNLGVLFYEQKNLPAALTNLQQAIDLKADYADAYYNLGTVFYLLRELDKAIAHYQKALALQPDYVAAHDMLVCAQLHCCDWSNYAENSAKIIAAVQSGQAGYNPFHFLAIADSANLHQQCATRYAKKYPLTATPLWTGERYQHQKIRIAYLSADFHNHATAFLMAELFETHDKQQFEISAISFGPRNHDAMQHRLVSCFERFVDVQQQSDQEVAQLLRDLEIDIAVDLKGYTQNCRPGILSYRPAPIQLSYLGYPGTLGADYIDYILADSFVIAPTDQQYYCEKVVYLPDTYQVNDSKRPIAADTPTRTEAGLPETGFVFCCFNNNYKINPAIFACWMRLLQKVENSVLWLLEDNQWAAHNLKQEATRHGICAQRLIFAARLPLDEHLSRHRLADLFLDTLPYNAHTTASDALWAGLPVLTCMGAAFPGRVAAGLINAIGLPELITHTLSDYENLAVHLANNPADLREIRSKLGKNRLHSPLFNTTRFRLHFESAYLTMWKRYQNGELPISFAVQPLA